MKLTKFFAFALAAIAMVGCEPIPGNNDDQPNTPNTPSDPSTPTSGAITLTVDKTAVSLEETVTFKVEQKGEDGVVYDVTDQSTIYNDDLEEIGTTFTPTESGRYSFFATKGAENSNYVTVTVMASTPDLPSDLQPERLTFKHRALVIDHTGMNCPACPYAMDELVKLAKTDWHNYYNEVTCHAGGYASGDPANSAAANALNGFQAGFITGYPSIVVNFYTGTRDYGSSSIINALSGVIKKDGADVGISLAVTGDSQSVYCAAQLKAKEANEYKVTAWLLENNIYCAGQKGADPSKDYHKIYNHALRNIAGEYSKTNVQGESIGTLESGKTYDCAFELPIVSTKWAWENMEVLVIVSAKDANGRWEVVNSAVCPVNDALEYEYI